MCHIRTDTNTCLSELLSPSCVYSAYFTLQLFICDQSLCFILHFSLESFYAKLNFFPIVLLIVTLCVFFHIPTPRHFQQQKNVLEIIAISLAIP